MARACAHPPQPAFDQRLGAKCVFLHAVQQLKQWNIRKYGEPKTLRLRFSCDKGRRVFICYMQYYVGICGRRGASSSGTPDQVWIRRNESHDATFFLAALSFPMTFHHLLFDLLAWFGVLYRQRLLMEDVHHHVLPMQMCPVSSLSKCVSNPFVDLSSYM